VSGKREREYVGFESIVIPDACRAIDVRSVQEMEAQFALNQVLVIAGGRL
jgi:hypothetical protein